MSFQCFFFRATARNFRVQIFGAEPRNPGWIPQTRTRNSGLEIIKNHVKYLKIFLGAAPPNPRFYIRLSSNYNICNYLYHFGCGNEVSNFFQSIRANVNDFANLCYWTWSFANRKYVSSRCEWWYNGCQHQSLTCLCSSLSKARRRRRFWRVFFVENWNSGFSFFF